MPTEAKETTTAKHSPLPWRVDRTNALGAYGVWTEAATHPGHDGAGYPSRVCSVYSQDPEIDEPREVRDANAALIVRAVNSHAALVKAAEYRLRHGHNDTCQVRLFEESQESYPCNCGHDQLTTAIAAAKEAK